MDQNKGLVSKINSKLRFIQLQELGGIVLFVLGIFFVAVAIHAMKKISEAKDLAHNVSNFFEHNPTWNPIIKVFGGKAEEKISDNYVPATAVLIGGIFLVVVGVIIFVHYRIKRSYPKS